MAELRYLKQKPFQPNRNFTSSISIGPQLPKDRLGDSGHQSLDFQWNRTSRRIVLDCRRPVEAGCPSKPTGRGCCATVSVPACWCRCRRNARWSAAGTPHSPRSGTKSIISRNTANHQHSSSNRFASAITTADHIHTSIIDVSSAIASTTSTRH